MLPWNSDFVTSTLETNEPPADESMLSISRFSMDEPFGALDAQTRNQMQKELLRIWAETKKTIIFITHSVDEAVYLSDRVIVLTSRPGRVKTVHTIELPRPRDRASQEFINLRKNILDELEQQRQGI